VGKALAKPVVPRATLNAVDGRTRSGVRAHEAYVSSRFDSLQSRFKHEVAGDDFRLRALLERLQPLSGRRVLDLGCGKGRFASKLKARGAVVVGIDLSALMLAEAARGIDRVRASARRLPFPGEVFDAIIAVEVFEHLAGIDEVLSEVARVLRPGGVLAVVDKNAGSWNALRPWAPNLAVKWLDERRGRWMYPAGSPVRECWFWPRAFHKRLAGRFVDLDIDYLLSPEEANSPLFRLVPGARLMTLWTARAPGGTR
jgi:2-polyprenyl-6-hydroxyphenyl methylase/3-demethylubiquinone-9 3-methyltransferase